MENKKSSRLIALLLILAVVAFFAGRALVSRSFSSTAGSISPLESALKKGIPQITDAKMAQGLDEQLMPIQATEVFPRDTKRVFCWFAWDKALPKTEMKAEWNYAIDDVHILTYAFRLPREKGSGGISLIMPTGKIFPVGTYRIDLMHKDRVLKSLTFKIK